MGLFGNGPLCRESIRRRSFDCIFFHPFVEGLFAAWTVGRKVCQCGLIGREDCSSSFCWSDILPKVIVRGQKKFFVKCTLVRI